MTTYNTYVSIPHASYNEFRSNTLNNQYDVDGSPIAQPYQCWDFAAEFWWNIGFPQGYPHNAGTHAAYGIWDDRDANKAYGGINYFTLIYDKTQIKRGDVIVYNQFAANPYGHVGFADEDYNGTDNIDILSQNNDHDYVTVHNYTLAYFRGAFRYIPWHQTPPTPTPTTARGKFPWVLYANKLRKKY